MSDHDALRRWWGQLSTEDRERARGLREGDPLPGDLLVSLTHAGIPQAAAWWPSTQTGPSFTVAGEVERFVQSQD